MAEQAPRIELHLEGPAAQGRILVDHLTAVAADLQVLLRRIASGRDRGAGRFVKEVEQACTLELVAFAPGRSVQLAFELVPLPEPTLFGNPGLEAMDQLLDALDRGEKATAGWGEMRNILDGLDRITKPLAEGVTSMRFRLVTPARRREATVTRAFRDRLFGIVPVVREPAETKLVGVIWEVNWRNHTAELFEPDRNLVRLSFGPELDERVTEARRKQVLAIGVSQREGGRVVRMELKHLQVHGSSEVANATTGFWENLTVEELADRQGVAQPRTLDDLVGDWPEDDSLDEFLGTVRRMRL